MTVCVSVKVHDCLIFSADSAITMTAPDGSIVNVYNHGNKVFNLHRDHPIGAMFCGMGTLGARSISNLAKELRYRFMKGDWQFEGGSFTMEQVVQRTHQFLGEKLEEAGSAANGGTIEFFVGGFGSASSHGELWKVAIAGGQAADPVCLRGLSEFGVDWAGQISPIARLMAGVDPGLPQAFMDAGVTPDAALALFNIAKASFQDALAYDAMPIGDAARLAEFLVDVTKGYYAFAAGADIVGGATDVAAVSKWEGFKWLKRKHYYASELNRGDHGHVC